MRGSRGSIINAPTLSPNTVHLTHRFICGSGSTAIARCTEIAVEPLPQS